MKLREQFEKEAQVGKYTRNNDAETYFKLYSKWLEQRQETASAVDTIVMWRSSDEPPEGKTGTWSDDVIAVTNLGNVYSIAFYHGMNGGNWQRLTAFEDGEEVYKWCKKPQAT
ncbi:MAG TPA: hypothetical protein VLA13_00370 [Massilibacterium sp.]|nr:hypothetical protein [Massilibacterium sp.]